MEDPIQTHDAIVLKDVVKSFKKQTLRGGHTTFKSELVKLISGNRKKAPIGQIHALKGLTLNIPRGATVGLVGRNGSGKSTLLKLITGIYPPTSGTVEVNGRISALLDLGAGFHPDFSGRENILINAIILGMTRSEAKARTPEIIEFSELGEFIDEPVRTYSSGMYMRLAFSVATHVEPDILIIDEILAVGDEHFSRKSLAKMNEFKRQGKTILLVTHDLSTVERWCETAAWIDGGIIRALGPSRTVVDQYRQAVALAEANTTTGGFSAYQAAGASLPDLDPTAVVSDLPHQLELGPLQLLKNGVPASEFDPEDPLEARVPFSTHASLTEVDFSFGLSRVDGSELYSTTALSEGTAIPSPLPPHGVLTLTLPRVGLLTGEYRVQLSARGPNGPLRATTLPAATIRVQSRETESGLFRPLHGWKVEEAADIRPIDASGH